LLQRNHHSSALLDGERLRGIKYAVRSEGLRPQWQ